MEDDQRIGKAVAAVLSRNNFAVDIAVNKAEGEEKAFGEDYDLMILDWMLPDGSGVGLCRDLREEKITTPVLMLTARSQVEDRVEGLDAGADDYLVKPFAVAELLARVRALLRRKEALVPDVFRLDDLEIDFGRQKVRRAGREIKLSPKEFGVLEFLARNSERVLSRLEILTHVWDENAELLTNTVDVHIRYLRKKIDECFLVKLIKTVKGRGYRLCKD